MSQHSSFGSIGSSNGIGPFKNKPQLSSSNPKKPEHQEDEDIIFSSIPFYERVSIAKESIGYFNLANFIDVDSLVDIRDTSDMWRVGKVVEVDQKSKKLMIRFDGWGEKWNEVTQSSMQLMTRNSFDLFFSKNASLQPVSTCSLFSLCLHCASSYI